MTTNMPTDQISPEVAGFGGRDREAGDRAWQSGIRARRDRQPGDRLDLAVDLQAKMFSEVATIGSLDVKLIYFRDTGPRRCRVQGVGLDVQPDAKLA